MQIEIDQSGKVEYTSAKTAVADSLGNSILLKAADKRNLQNKYRNFGFPRAYTVGVFSCLCALLIKSSYSNHARYLIDTEYPGKDNEIKGSILIFAKRLKVPLRRDQIWFGHIGKKSKAHEHAYNSFVRRKNIGCLNPGIVEKIVFEKFEK